MMKRQQGTSQGAGKQLPQWSFPRAMSRLGKETHLTCTSPGFSGLYRDRISTCSGTSLYPYLGISSQCCRTYKALCSSSADQFSSATPLLFLTEVSAAGHSQVEDEGIWLARATSGCHSQAQVRKDNGLGKQAPPPKNKMGRSRRAKMKGMSPICCSDEENCRQEDKQAKRNKRKRAKK